MSASLGSSRTAAKARTRELLLAAAAQVFAEQGRAGASVDAIAARAGYTIGALYSHFSGKDELFLELFQRYLSGHLLDIEEIAGHCGDEADVCTSGHNPNTSQDGPQHRSALECEFTRYALTRPEALARLAGAREDARTALAGALASRGDLRADPRTLATMLIALVEGLRLQHQVDPAGVPPGLAADAVRLLLGDDDGGTRPPGAAVENGLRTWA